MKTFVTLVTSLGCFALYATTHAVTPPPDGAYPGYNTGEGQNALFSLTIGAGNAAVGWYSLFGNTDGSFNTGVGAGTLLFNQSGNNNTAIGAAALLFNTGSDNTATGVSALASNTTGDANTATGYQALANNTAGNNTATGAFALQTNTTGWGNTASGAFALSGNTTANWNTATGIGALYRNTSGFENTATGAYTLNSNTEGSFNTAAGDQALYANESGVSNTALGWGALLSNETGSNNTAIGVRAGQNATGNFNIYIGSQLSGVQSESNTIRIGDNLPNGFNESACYIGGIFAQQVGGSGLAVFVDANGKLGMNPSSRRFKRDINRMDKASEAILSLQPVTFHYKSDSKNTPCFGLIAEEVGKVNPELVVRDKDGEPLSVRYEQINAMLLNEFLKEHRKIQAQERKIQKQETTIARQQKQIEALTFGLRKVSDQLELGAPAPRAVQNDSKQRRNWR